MISEQLATLGHPQRITIFRMLMRRYPDSVPAGELAAQLDIKSSTLSSYLNALQRANLITQKRSGTSLLYSVDMQNVQHMLNYLIVDCCRGRPDVCLPMNATVPQSGNRTFNVLFVCTGNSARSIMAEALLRSLGGARFNVYSAGTRPASEPNPAAMQVLRDKGYDTSCLHSKSVDAFSKPDAPKMDFVFTVCNQAANEECPTWDGQPISGHWGMPDPTLIEGTAAERTLAFQSAYGGLKRRIEAFTALPFETLDRIALQSAVDDIAKTPIEEMI